MKTLKRLAFGDWELKKKWTLGTLGTLELRNEGILGFEDLEFFGFLDLGTSGTSEMGNFEPLDVRNCSTRSASGRGIRRMGCDTFGGTWRGFGWQSDHMNKGWVVSDKL